MSCLYPGRFSKFPRNLTLCVCGGAVSLLKEISTKTEPESEQVCSGTQAPAPGVPSQEAEGRALRRGPVSCSIRSVIPTGPGLSPQRWLGRAGLASSGGGAASHPGHISASGSICAHRPRDPTCRWSQQLGRVPAPHFLPEVSHVHPLCLVVMAIKPRKSNAFCTVSHVAWCLDTDIFSSWVFLHLSQQTSLGSTHCLCLRTKQD